MLLLFWRVPKAATATVRAAGASGSALAVRKGGVAPIALRAPALVAAAGRHGGLGLVAARGVPRAAVLARKTTTTTASLRGAVRGVPVGRKSVGEQAQLRGFPRTVSTSGLRVSVAAVLLRARPRATILATAVTGSTFASIRLGSQPRGTSLVRRGAAAAVLTGAGAAGTTVPSRLSRATLKLGVAGGSVLDVSSARSELALFSATAACSVDSATGRRSRGRVELGGSSWTETSLTVGHSGVASLRTQSAGTLVLYTSILSPSVPFDPHRPLDLGTVYRGDTIILPVWQAQDRAGNVIDLSGSTLWFTAKVDLAVVDATTPTIQCSTTDGGIVILDAPTGLYRVTLVSSQTYALIDDTTFTFDVQVITPAPITRTIRWGTLRVVRDVTRAVA